MHNIFKNNFFVFGHRGAPEHGPENTMFSFKKAIEFGVDGLEVDVQETADGILVIHHDIKLDRIGIKKAVSEFKYDELKQFDVSLKWNSIYGSQQIPTLEKIIELLENNDLILNIEIKSTSFLPSSVVDKTIAFIKRYNLINRCIVSSFNPLILFKAKRLLPDLFTSLIWSKEDQHWLLSWYKPMCWICNPNGFHPDIKFLNKNIINWAKNKNLKIMVFNINSSDQLRFVNELGVDGIFTDDPLIIKKINY